MSKNKTISWDFLYNSNIKSEQTVTSSTSTDGISDNEENRVPKAENSNLINNNNRVVLAGQAVKYLMTVKTLASPKGLVFSMDNKEIWVTSALNKHYGIGIYDAITGKNIKNIDLNSKGGVEIILNKDGSRAYVSQMESSSVYEIDTQSKEILRIFKTNGSWTKILALSYDGQKLFASNWSSNDITEIDLANGQILRKIPVVKTPRGIYPTQDGNYLYVAGFENGDIQKIDLRDLSSKIIFTSGGAMRHLIADGSETKLYVSDMAKNIIWQVDLNTDEVNIFAHTDNNPNTIALSADNKILFVSCRGVNTSADNYTSPGPEWGSVMIFDIVNGKMLDVIIGGNQPTALSLSSSSDALAFSNFLDSDIELYAIPAYETLKNAGGGISNIYKPYLKK